MKDLITEARELIEALHAGEYDDEYIGTGAYLMLDELCDALEKAEAQLAAYRWIPVTERLPDVEADEVLLTDGESCYTGFWREDAKAWDNVNQGWVRCGTNEGGYPIAPTITHWMPLPEPPKKGE